MTDSLWINKTTVVVRARIIMDLDNENVILDPSELVHFVLWTLFFFAFSSLDFVVLT